MVFFSSYTNLAPTRLRLGDRVFLMVHSNVSLLDFYATKSIALKFGKSLHARILLNVINCFTLFNSFYKDFNMLRNILWRFFVTKVSNNASHWDCHAAGLWRSRAR